MRTTTLLTTLLLAAPVALAQAPYQFEHPDAGLTVELPPGFDLEQAVEDEHPEVSVFFFLDHRTWTGLTVALHTYLSPDQRAEWVAGDAGRRDLGHLAHVEAIDPSDFPLPAGAAFNVYLDGDSPEDRGAGVVLYGCDEMRCYRVDVFGNANDFERRPRLAADLISGVRFRD